MSLLRKYDGLWSRWKYGYGSGGVMENNMSSLPHLYGMEVKVKKKICGYEKYRCYKIKTIIKLFYL